MSKITVVVEDNVVVINGFAIFDVPMDNIPHDYRVLQWNNGTGVIETRTGKNIPTSEIGVFQSAVDYAQTKYDEAHDPKTSSLDENRAFECNHPVWLYYS